MRSAGYTPELGSGWHRQFGVRLESTEDCYTKVSLGLTRAGTISLESSCHRWVGVAGLTELLISGVSRRFGGVTGLDKDCLINRVTGLGKNCLTGRATGPG
ncbi:hypothetical protein BHE74_00057433 [Ensete ventricosum]|nr:hypothetical protein BHE74_00057433 [Ensete ventricosum]